MGTIYNHLTLEERCRLRGLMEVGLGVREIARSLGRHRTAIHREVDRNRCADGYRPDGAGRRAWARKLRGSKIERSTRLCSHVEDRLAMGWSPEQIAGRMELEDLEHATCAESIDRHTYGPVGRGARLPRLLAQRKAKRGRGDATAKASRPSPTARPSIRGPQKPICAASSTIGRAV